MTLFQWDSPKTECTSSENKNHGKNHKLESLANGPRPGNADDCPEAGQRSLQSHPPCRTSRQGGIDDVVVVDAEHVHAAILKHRIAEKTLGIFR